MVCGDRSRAYLFGDSEELFERFRCLDFKPLVGDIELRKDLFKWGDLDRPVMLPEWPEYGDGDFFARFNFLELKPGLQKVYNNKKNISSKKNKQHLRFWRAQTSS